MGESLHRQCSIVHKQIQLLQFDISIRMQKPRFPSISCIAANCELFHVLFASPEDVCELNRAWQGAQVSLFEHPDGLGPSSLLASVFVYSLCVFWCEWGPQWVHWWCQWSSRLDIGDKGVGPTHESSATSRMKYLCNSIWNYRLVLVLIGLRIGNSAILHDAFDLCLSQVWCLRMHTLKAR